MSDCDDEENFEYVYEGLGGGLMSPTEVRVTDRRAEGNRTSE